MKYAALLATVLLTFGSAAAVVGHNGSGDVTVTSSSSASGTVAAGPNGTEYRATVSMVDRSRENASDSVRNVTFTEDGVNFEGTIVAPTPCHVIDHRIEESGDDYVMNIDTVKEGDQVCTQVITGIDYDASFQAEEPFSIEVRHNGKVVKTLVHPENGKSSEKPLKPGVIEIVTQWLRDLF